jgi:hypothetical protein
MDLLWSSTKGAVMEQTVATPNATDIVAATAATTQVEGKPADAVADAAKSVDASDEQDTLLGSKEEEGKKEESTPAPAPKVVPEKYDIKAPEGMSLDAKAVDQFTPVFKELGLDQAQAQKLVDAYAPYMQQQVEAMRQENLKVFKDMVNEWGEQTKKELGADYGKKLAPVSKLMDKFADPGYRELMNETGLGNNPLHIKFMLKISEQLSQDTLADSSMKKQDNSVEALAKKLYPTMNQ